MTVEIRKAERTKAKLRLGLAGPSLDQDHNAHASKDRTNLFKDEVFTPSEKVGERILEWLNSGKEAAPEDISRKKAKILHCLKLLGADVTTQEATRKSSSA